MIVNVGPVHLELLGTVERVAAAKAELIRDLEPGATCVVPAGEPLLEAHLRDDLETVTFGAGGDVTPGLVRRRARRDRRPRRARSSSSSPTTSPTTSTTRSRRWPRGQPSGSGPRAPSTSPSRPCAGRSSSSPGGVTVVNDCYNANPMSMRAALDHLAASPAERRIAVLGGMGELGEAERDFHRAVGEHARPPASTCSSPSVSSRSAIGEGYGGETYAVATPEEAAAVLEEIAGAGDRVLIKGSRSVGLERVLGERGAEAMQGEILIAGMASMLICIFLGPRFIEFLREQEFGQHIREDGPEGPPRQGGHADDGRTDHVRRDRRAVPDPRQLRRRQPRRVRRRRSPAPPSASSTTGRRSPTSARSASPRATSSRSRR